MGRDKISALIIRYCLLKLDLGDLRMDLDVMESSRFDFAVDDNAHTFVMLVEDTSKQQSKD